MNDDADADDDEEEEEEEEDRGDDDGDDDGDMRDVHDLGYDSEADKVHALFGRYC